MYVCRCESVYVYVCVSIFHILGWGFEFFVHFLFYMISYVLEMGIQKCLKYGYKLQGNPGREMKEQFHALLLL